MFKKSLVLAAVVAASSFSSIAPSTAQSAALAASCATTPILCVEAVRTTLGPAPTSAEIAQVVASLNGLDLNNPQIAANVAAAIRDAATLSPDPVQVAALQSIAEAVAQGGETATAAIDQVQASAT